MKKNKLTMAVVAGIAGVTGMANANQFVNPEGTGEVLIYPYYTVNNGIDTSYSIVNTTNLTKAVKVRFLEGENSVEVLDFNVYLSPFDVWTGALTSTTSTINDGGVDHIGEPSGLHITADESCAPFLTKAGQEFLPYAIDASQAAFATAAGLPNNSLQRGTDGHMEVLEMATFSAGTDAADAALHATSGAGAGVPADCGYFEANFPLGSPWLGTPEEETTGGLFGSASLVNVAEGLAMTYDAVAVEDFWEGGIGSHTEPGDLSPSIANGDDDITVFDEGVATDYTYTGASARVEAFSGLFMRQEIYNEYALDSLVAGKSEWVITFPSKNQHVNRPVPVLPFINPWNGADSCHEFDLSIWDREEQQEQATGGTVSPRPPGGAAPSLCFEANVLQFKRPGATIGTASDILGSDNLVTVTTPAVGHATENGWARMQFNDDGIPATETYVDENNFRGLPVVGFSAQQFTNAGAGPGLLAQYAGLFVHKGEVVNSL